MKKTSLLSRKIGLILLLAFFALTASGGDSKKAGAS
jgi:hypothetical protein